MPPRRSSRYSSRFLSLVLEESDMRSLPLRLLPVLREEHSWGSSSLTNALLDYEFAFSDLPEADHWVSPVYLPYEDERGPFGKTEQVIIA